MPIFPFIPRRRPRNQTQRGAPAQDVSHAVRRHFFNESRFQTYASFFPLWGGWATAGHCLSETDGLCPPFAKGRVESWPGALDAALIGTRLPERAPPAPRIGQSVIATGFPAGSQHAESRQGAVYHERQPGQWIVQMEDGSEPVVTGMSGGPVLDAQSLKPIGILITRNSPADLDADGDADESYDFIALSAVWEALRLPRVV